MSRDHRSAKTRNEILDAAWALVSEKGAEVSMSAIAEAAGISRQSVYLHFGSRGGLLMALVKRADDRFEIKERMFASFALADPHKRLDRTIVVWIEFVVKIYPVASDLVRLRATDEDASAAWEDRMADLRSWLRTLVKSLKNDKALATGWTIKDASDYLWAAFSVQIWGLLVQDCDWSPQRAETILRRTICRALLDKS